MDNSSEGLLLIWTTTIILVSFLVSLLSVMIIYRQRRISHNKEIETINEKFASEVLQSQMETQKFTMQQIGREIHDDVGQKLVLAALYVQQIPIESELAKNKIEVVSSIINESLADLRSLSRGLSEAGSMDMDLCDLIRIECDRVLLAGTHFSQFESNIGHIHVSKTVKNFILRILQEFIQNSLKHGGGNQILIKLFEDEQQVLLTLSDNGKGFTLNELAYSPGIGIKNMEKRAKMMGADFQLISSPNSGTRLILQIPANKLN